MTKAAFYHASRASLRVGQFPAFPVGIFRIVRSHFNFPFFTSLFVFIFCHEFKIDFKVITELLFGIIVPLRGAFLPLGVKLAHSGTHIGQVQIVEVGLGAGQGGHERGLFAFVVLLHEIIELQGDIALASCEGRDGLPRGHVIAVHGELSCGAAVIVHQKLIRPDSQQKLRCAGLAVETCVVQGGHAVFVFLVYIHSVPH
mmetsp:Transcript_15038/g.26498  ORF Transcript_15038/g.26498 Transcript_15038/m.26498 type:complete len:200 (-) Transcript_15038:1561-2160(-)